VPIVSKVPKVKGAQVL